MPTPVTLRDVAAATGVHVSTVSRILRGERDRVRPETVERVVAQARELGYTSNRWAASLRSGRTGVLGMLVPRITDGVLASVFEAFEQEAATQGYMSLVASTWDNPERRAEGVRRFTEQRVDGIVVADARLSDPDLETIHASGTPLVLASRRTEASIPFVVSDDLGGGRLAGQHVAATTARRIGVIAGPRYASTAVERTSGFLDGLALRGDDHDVVVVHSGFDLESGQEAMEGLLRSGRPDAVYAVNDFAAIGAMSTLARHGLAPGRDVAVVGYNDIAISDRMLVPLTSVRADLRAMGRIAFGSICAVIAGGPVEDQRVPTELVVRESSTGLLPTRLG